MVGQGFTAWRVSCFEMTNRRGEHSLENVFVRYKGTKC